MENLSKRTEEQKKSNSKWTDEKMENFLHTITNSVGLQERRVNSTIAKWKRIWITSTTRSTKESPTWKKFSMIEETSKTKTGEHNKIQEYQKVSWRLNQTRNWTIAEGDDCRDWYVDWKCPAQAFSQTFHICYYLFQWQRWQEQIRHISKHGKERIEREENNNITINGCRQKIPPKKVGVHQMLHSHEAWHRSRWTDSQNTCQYMNR